MRVEEQREREISYLFKVPQEADIRSWSSD